MWQQENRVAAPPSAVAATGALDAIRLAQFLDLQRDLLLASGNPDTLPDRLVQWLAVFLGVPGAALAVIQEGRYRLLATYGVGATHQARWDGLALRDAEVMPALAGMRPLVLDDVEGDATVRTVVLPFRAAEAAGAVHLVLGEDRRLTDDDLQLACALAGLAGVALANARQCRRLAEVARLKGDALAAMAHDLRAPLNALVGYAGLLGEGAFGALSTEQHEVSRTLERQAIELVDLLGATLDVARLETGQLPLRVEEFALADVLGALAAGTFRRASGEGRLVSTMPADLPRLRTDRVKVKEIVQNLVDNALKHSAPDGHVAVEVAFAGERDAVRITVRDDGPGIAADVLPHLFERFVPGPGPQRGTGFGLYIVRSFTEALGGRVAAWSQLGEGTAVTAELPRVAPTR